jgi:hypothetical protein
LLQRWKDWDDDGRARDFDEARLRRELEDKLRRDMEDRLELLRKEDVCLVIVIIGAGLWLPMLLRKEDVCLVIAALVLGLWLPGPTRYARKWDAWSVARA